MTDSFVLPQISMYVGNLVQGTQIRAFASWSEIAKREYAQKTPTPSPRQREFERALHVLSQATGGAIPVAFRDMSGHAFVLDAGCIGHAVANNVLEPVSSGAMTVVLRVRRDAGGVEPPAYASQLEAHGFSITKQTKKTIEFTHPALDTPIYLKVNAAGEAQTRAPIVVHPGIAALLSQVSGLDAWSVGEPHHMSNMTAFPKRVHGGKRATHYGISISFDAERGVAAFLATLLGLEPLETAPPLNDETVPPNIGPTERLALRNARIGQGRFRYDLIELWEACSVTNVRESTVLIASHIKRWADSDNHERLDKYNGLLLTPNLDRLFEHGFITFDDNKKIILSPSLKPAIAAALGVHRDLELRSIYPENVPYLDWHRKNRFRKG